VMGGMIAVVVLALLMVPVFFVTVMRVLGRDRGVREQAAHSEMFGPPAPLRAGLGRHGEP
jgi:multidrug efflux pump